MYNSFCRHSDDGYHWFSADYDYELKCDFCGEIIFLDTILRLVNAATVLTGTRARIAAGLLEHMVGESTVAHQKALREFAERLLVDG